MRNNTPQPINWNMIMINAVVSILATVIAYAIIHKHIVKL